MFAIFAFFMMLGARAQLAVLKGFLAGGGSDDTSRANARVACGVKQCDYYGRGGGTFNLHFAEHNVASKSHRAPWRPHTACARRPRRTPGPCRTLTPPRPDSAPPLYRSN